MAVRCKDFREIYGGASYFCQQPYRPYCDLSKLFTERKIDMKNMNCRTNKQDKATISVSFEVGSKEELASLIEKIRQIESVIDVERTTG